MLTGFRGGRRTEGKAHLENLGVEDKTIRKLILKNFVGGGGDMDWIDLSQDRDSLQAFVNAVMNLRVP